MKKLRYLFILFFLYPLSLLAQQTVTISGKVTDKADGTGLPGATVSAGGISVGTDANGDYKIIVPQSATQLTFKFVGMADVVEQINNRSVINVSLSTTQAQLQEVVVVGYGTQKRETITGSVSTLKSKDIVVTKNESVVNSLTGKIPGLRIQQRTSEPGGYANAFNIRGYRGADPLIVIDGVIADGGQEILGRMDPNEIENISVLKDAAASIYGIRASGGVILVTTKKGDKNNKFDISYSINQSWQQFLGMPEGVGAIDYMMLTNEKRKHNFDNNFLSVQPPTFNYSDFEPFLNGTRQTSDWTGIAFREFAGQQQHNLNVNGGTEKISYFFNFGYQKQDGVFKSGDVNYNKYNFRSNVTVDIVKGLKAQVLASGWLDKKYTPFQSQWTVYKYAWNTIPRNPIFANDNPLYPAVIKDNVNPAVVTDAEKGGWRDYRKNNFTGQLNLQYEIPGVKGLTAKALYNYSYGTDNFTDNQRAYELYTYEPETDTYIPQTVSSPSRITRTYRNRIYAQSQLSLNYVNTFFDDHNVSATLVYEQSHQTGDNFYAAKDLLIPSDYLFGGVRNTNMLGDMDQGGLYDVGFRSVIGRVNYDYKGKYLAEFSFRRDGSNKYMPGPDQWGFFPAVSIGWVLTKESFFRNIVSENILTSLKVRGSWGETGDEQGNGFNYINGYTYPVNQYIFGSSAVNGSVQKLGNPGLSWTINTKKNIGLDYTLLNGKIDGTIEVFRSDRTGLPTTPAIALPGTVGAPVPQINYEADRVQGLDFNISYRNKFGDVGLNVSANIGTTRAQRTKILQGPQGNAYQNWRNNQLDRYSNIWWGLEYAGQFTSYNQIYNHPVNTGGGNQGVIPGDYYYQDWNEDGVIDGKDERPIATYDIPLYNYGANISVNYKNFDMTVLLQGAAGVYVQYGEQFASPLMYDGSALTRFLDSWHTVDPEANIYDPNTQWVPGFYPAMGSPDARGTKAVQNASYLRIKTLEFGYSLPTSFLQKIGVKRFRVYANSYNFLTFTGLKNYDPEHQGPGPNDNGFGDVALGGYTYPMNRTFSVGANISF
ncbi:SusC/RagA family TonB-linked outer membrane protein [Mucilaginibacter limnophilus]|uniref:SusC/RagA family TonB-linked outer membrane protein n=1 Tax=Mucilaginibacter limnophilus TaxID=1932778 RepID=A0A437MR56_9SPHI|nr:SusC/RagA family TonB-linked outer membrane protein [Mucilaginibacter limnophilus]RVU00139.1 SusC/RagA family TonB-linked outer membrane protein [Mucilaginibacter limnophilus]